MSAYIVFQRESTQDQDALAHYSARSGSTFEGHDIQVLAANGDQEVLEGSPVEGVVILQFPSTDAAREWYRGDAYQEVVKDRFAGATYRGVLVEGTPD
jgi:uncharacterized protein (DUF1330 family)